MSYRAAGPGEPEESAKRYFASCFVVEFAGQWFLVTAAHLINEIRNAISSGASHSLFFLHDRGAGSPYPLGVPTPFVVGEWILLDNEPLGADYAAWPMRALIAANLAKGGVLPITEGMWGEPPFNQYPVWLMVGMPEESISEEGADGLQQMKLVSLALQACPSPSDRSAVIANRLFAVIQRDPSRDVAIVDDIAGMSGGPIFGIEPLKGAFRYWLIGVQSGWFKDIRTVSFCPAPQFLDVVREAWLTFGNPPDEGGESRLS